MKTLYDERSIPISITITERPVGGREKNVGVEKEAVHLFGLSLRDEVYAESFHPFACAAVVFLSCSGGEEKPRLAFWCISLPGTTTAGRIRTPSPQGSVVTRVPSSMP
jgi:hypothetical protein